MNATMAKAGTHTTVTLDEAEAELLELALKRAMFEDTPPERQRDIVDFATALIRMLAGTSDAGDAADSGDAAGL